MHALCLHVPEFLALDGNIEYFTQQGMCKYKTWCAHLTKIAGNISLIVLWLNLKHGI